MAREERGWAYQRWDQSRQEADSSSVPHGKHPPPGRPPPPSLRSSGPTGLVPTASSLLPQGPGQWQESAAITPPPHPRLWVYHRPTLGPWRPWGGVGGGAPLAPPSGQPSTCTPQTDLLTGLLLKTPRGASAGARSAKGQASHSGFLLRSRSHAWWFPAPHWALRCQHGACLGFSLSHSFCPSPARSLSLSLCVCLSQNK